MEGIQPRCPKCNSTQTHIRFMTNELVCQKCGEISKLNKDNKKQNG